MSRFVAGLVLGVVVLAIPAPAGAQAEGPGFCDIIGKAFGDPGKQQCIDQGGEQLDQAVRPLTDGLCTAGDAIIVGFEGGGAPPEMTQPARDFLTEGGCTFATVQQQPETTTTTAPGGTEETTTTTTASGGTSGGTDETTSTTAGAVVAGVQASSAPAELPATGAALFAGAGVGLLSLAALLGRLARAAAK